MVPVDEGDFHLLSGAQALNCYRFHTHNARHYFCRHCGIYTHHKRRRDDKFAVNLGCLEKASKTDLDSIVLFEGRKLT